MKEQLAVAALRNGTVIDHIPSEALFKCVDLLDLANLNVNITIGNNLESEKLGKKGIIKIADTEFHQDVISRIAIIAPTAVINTIRDYEVVEKTPVTLPDELIDIVMCDNPKCVSRVEPIPSRFEVLSADPVLLRCHYCEHDIKEGSIVLK